MEDEAPQAVPKRSLRRVLVIGLVIFVVLVAILAILAWTVGDTLLPMQYEGFD